MVSIRLSKVICRGRHSSIERRDLQSSTRRKYDLSSNAAADILIGCKYFIESLELSPFKTKYPKSNFVARLDAVSAAHSKLEPFAEIQWSLTLWQDYGQFNNTPFRVRNYPDIWKDGTCPTEGQFVSLTYKIDAHTDGLV